MLPVIGIIGGAGPAASARFHSRLIAAFQRHGCWRDADFPGIVHVSVPFAGLSKQGVQDDDAVRNDLHWPVQLLKTAGARIVAVPCNSLHADADHLSRRLGIQILNMVDLTSEELARRRLTRVAVLSSASTRQSGLYTKSLARRGIEEMPLADAEQAQLTELIERLMGDGNAPGAEAELTNLARQVLQRGAAAVVIACTELSLLTLAPEIATVAVDSSLILAEAVVRKALYENIQPTRKFQPGGTAACHARAAAHTSSVQCAPVH